MADRNEDMKPSRKDSTRPRKRAHHKRRRPNALKRDNQSAFDKIPPVMKDPVFLHHVASALLRYLELSCPAELQIMGTLNQVDAEFVEPEGVQ